MDSGRGFKVFILSLKYMTEKTEKEVKVLDGG